MSNDLQVKDRFPVSFAIFACARAHRAVMATLLRELGLHTGQEIMLMHLWERDEQSQRQLAQMLGADHSTVAKSVRRLEEAGLVRRTRSESDGRVSVVRLTDAGRALEKRVEQAWAELDRRTTEGMSQGDQARFVELADSVAVRLREPCDEPG